MTLVYILLTLFVAGLAILVVAYKASQLKPISVEFKITAQPNEGVVKVRGTTKGETFDVDLKACQCTCSEFAERRSAFPINDIRRLCRHLLKAYEKAGIWGQQDEIALAMLRTGPIEGGAWAHRALYKANLLSGAEVFFGATKGKDWISIYTRKRKRGEKAGHFTGAFDSFGFNRATGQWSYGTAPPAAKEIKKLLDSVP